MTTFTGDKIIKTKEDEKQDLLITSLLKGGLILCHRIGGSSKCYSTIYVM